MSKMRLLQEAVGQTFEGFVLVKSVAVRQNTKGADYLDFVLADSEGECAAKLWDYSSMTHGVYGPNDIIKVRGSIVIWKDTDQLKIERIRHTVDADQVNLELLIPCAPCNPQTIYDELYALADSFSDDECRRLVQYIMRENKDRLLLFPAAVKLHHATRGGLLHHTHSIVALCREVIRLYPKLNGDLLYTGAILHDIGKLEEMDTNSLGLAGAYTDFGQLLGHINMGVSLVDSTCELLGISRQTALLVEHMILSHHSLPEFGSPKLPMFPEAEVLAQCDLLDSKLYEMFAALDGVQVGGFSERQWALDNRQLFKHGR